MSGTLPGDLCLAYDEAMSRGIRNLRSREGAALLAGGFTNGPAELIDFLIPLWAGIALGVGASQVGFLVAAELIVSVLARPVAGWLADIRERRTLAGIGAVLYGLSCGGYAIADSMAIAYLAAILGGVGGALLWVSLRAVISERLSTDSSVFARLMSAQETGMWVAFVAGLLLLAQTDLFPPVFLACGAACLVGAVVLFASPAMSIEAASAARAAVGLTGSSSRAVAMKLRPMLITVVMTALAESSVGILLLLHLQRGFNLGVIQTAYVFLPGAIAMGVLPPLLHKLVLRVGRRRAVIAASVFSGIFAVSLAWAPGPAVIAALWILCGAAWAMLMPIEQAVIAEAAPGQVGRAMGIYTSAGLIGAAIGAFAAGLLYEFSSWQAACLISGLIILSGAALGPWAIRRLGVQDIPTEQPATIPRP